jgi:putative zinc finger protein
MSQDEHDVGALGIYVLGGLGEDERRSVEAHLAGCERCRQERTELEQMKAALGEVPSEAFLEGPPDGGELLVQRTLRQVREEAARQGLRHRSLVGVAAAVTLAAALGAGVLLGRNQESGVVARPTPGPTATAVPGTVVASRTDPGTGAELTVRVVPAAGWVRVNATVAGIPEAQECRLWVIAEDGRRVLAGSWLVSAKGAAEGTVLDGSALVAPADVAAVEVDNVAGRKFVTVPV